MIPDIAYLRDRYPPGWRKTFYMVLALGWQGTPGQEKVLNRAIAIMAIMVIPIAVSVHTVVSFVFSMTLQPMWHSSIFGPYFVVGAIFSGVACLLIVMGVLRKAFHLEDYLQPIHFSYLGLLLLVFVLFWAYFTFAEYLTAFYGDEPEEMRVFWAKWTGPWALGFWAMVVCNFVIPLPLLAINRFRTIGGTMIASAFIVIGMWLERFIIVVPTLANPRQHMLPTGSYWPTWVEVGLMIGSFGLFALLYLVFSRFFPLVSIHEVREGRDHTEDIVIERVRRYTIGQGRMPG
ncbi:MAG: polysulfide reductase NrfD, partial [Deltaproteobacteria bacterium]|nr:polysulfide reductase NrfD [Deltaproteobacteria bacterium]